MIRNSAETAETTLCTVWKMCRGINTRRHIFFFFKKILKLQFGLRLTLYSADIQNKNSRS